MKKKFLINEEEIEVEIISPSHFVLEGQVFEFTHTAHGHGRFTLRHGAENIRGVINHSRVFLPNAEIEIEEISAGKTAERTSRHKPHSAPMTGTIRKVYVKTGDKVSKGQPLMVMEAMKLQLTIEAISDGKITALHAKEGELVEEGKQLAEVSDA